MKCDELLNILDAVRRRERLRRSLDGAGCGLLVGEILALSQMTCFLSFAFAGLALGGLIGLILPVDRSATARNVDRFYDLKDRLLTALELLSRPEPSVLERLQIEDALRHGQQVEPKFVVPIRIPKTFFAAFFLAVVVVIACFSIPNPKNRVSAANETQKPELVAVAQTMRKELVGEIDALVEKHPENETLKNLSDNLRRLGTRLDAQTADLRESLATLSEMDGAIRSTLAGLQLDAVDRSLRELGGALTGAEETRDIGQALKDGNTAAAADELERFDPSATDSMTETQRRALAGQLRQTVEEMRNRHQNSLAASTETFADDIEGNEETNDDEHSSSAGAREMAARLREHAARKEIGKKLEQKLDLIEDGKSDAAEDGTNSSDDRENGGGSSTAPSNRGGTEFGEGTAGNPASGDATELDGKREKHELSGTPGDGPSEVERLRSPDHLEEKSRLDYQNILPEYRRQSEAVLEAEPIPRGQRRMIRDYFEALGKE